MKISFSLLILFAGFAMPKAHAQTVRTCLRFFDPRPTPLVLLMRISDILESSSGKVINGQKALKFSTPLVLNSHEVNQAIVPFESVTKTRVFKLRKQLDAAVKSGNYQQLDIEELSSARIGELVAQELGDISLQGGTIISPQGLIYLVMDLVANPQFYEHLGYTPEELLKNVSPLALQFYHECLYRDALSQRLFDRPTYRMSFMVQTSITLVAAVRLAVDYLRALPATGRQKFRLWNLFVDDFRNKFGFVSRSAYAIDHETGELSDVSIGNGHLIEFKPDGRIFKGIMNNVQPRSDGSVLIDYERVRPVR